MMRFLVVDDERVSRAKMQKILSQIGQCDVVDNGAEAVRAFSNAWHEWRPYDVITMDVVMPDMDGTQCLYQIRKLEKRKNVGDRHKVKVIMVTSDANKGTITTSIQAGCDDYIVKPFNPFSIREKLRKHGFNVLEPV